MRQLAPWLYTGALENEPKLVRKLTEMRPLWGNDANVLDRVRRPRDVAVCLRHCGLSCPDLRDLPASVPLHQHEGCLEDSGQSRWLEKPMHGGGGRGIRFWRNTSNHLSKEGIYVQEYIEGDSCAAVYAAIGQRGISWA